MRLATPSQVVTAAAVAVNDGSLARAASALEHSVGLLESILETKFAETTQVDSFSIPIHYEAPYTLRLTNRFIDKDAIKVYSKPAGAVMENLVAEYELSADNWTVDVNKGTVEVHTLLEFGGANCVAVLYTSGFPADKDDPDLLAVPEFLKQIAISAAVLEMNTAPSTVANRRDKMGVSVSKVMYGYLAKTCEAYHRPRMTVEYPVSSVISE